VIKDLLIIGQGLVILWIFLNVGYYGSYCMWEPVEWILILETLASVFIVGWAVREYIKGLKNASS